VSSQDLQKVVEISDRYYFRFQKQWC